MIKLNQNEIHFLLNNLKLDINETRLLNSNLPIDEDFADKLRDMCMDKLDFCGYDENYEPAEIGKELNKLIKLFIG